MKDRDDLLISTSGLSKTYKNIQALKSLDLCVPKNSIFGFLGPNGAGKSTAIKLLLGLVKPTSGAGSIFGMDILKDSAEIRKRTGFLPQNPRYYDYMTAREILRFTAGFFYNRSDRLVDLKIDEVLGIAGLSDRADRVIKGFSGGEMQRLGIAQAQVNSPELLILDEPAASLDPMGRRDVLEVMRALKGKTTIFYSTHILDDVERVSDAVAILNKGELVALAPVDELLASRDKVVYDIVLRGDSEQIRNRIREQQWVDSVKITENEGTARWSLTAKDPEYAERNLLRTLLGDENIIVREFTRRRDELEDVFMRIVEGGNNA